MTRTPTFDYDYIVIGSGAGGSPAASILASAGKKVAIVDKSTLGGESPNWDDIPTGAFIHAATSYRTAKAASTYGLRTSTVGYNYPSLLSWKDTVIKRTGASNNRYYYEKQGISVFIGNAHFLSPNEITVNRRHLSARKFLIATGSEWRIPAIAGLEDIPYHTPKTIFTFTRPPKTLFIVGMGITAIELAHAFSTFGTKVYLASPARRVVPEFDTEVSELLTQDGKQHRGITFLPQTTVIAAQKQGLQKRITFVQGRTERSVRVDEIVIADQRVPATDIGLENAGVTYDQDGISVNASLQTSARHIFAAGSVIDVHCQTHDILAQSRICAQNLLHRATYHFDNMPRLYVAFTHPEVAQVGFNEYECEKHNISIKTATVPLKLTARSNITDQQTGLVKLIANTKKDVLVGASIIAPQASDMISELALAIRYGLTAQQIMTTPHCFTSWSEAIRIAAGKLL